VGVTVRDLGLLRVIASGEAQLQQEPAAALGVDRTSMAALLDVLERRRIVARRPSEQDRRRNIIALTDHGWADVPRLKRYWQFCTNNSPKSTVLAGYGTPKALCRSRRQSRAAFR
jgi:DNA-binding MarR family transcriptional regulator